MTDDEWSVNGLLLPHLLISLLTSGRWRHPGDELLGHVIPWLPFPLDFMATIDELRRHNRLIAESVPEQDDFFEIGRSHGHHLVEMPWLDLDRAVYIAVCRYAGDDAAVALDYRTNSADPRVLATDISNPRHYSWRQVSPTFSQFVDELHLQ